MYKEATKYLVKSIVLMMCTQEMYIYIYKQILAYNMFACNNSTVHRLCMDLIEDMRCIMSARANTFVDSAAH